MKKLHLSILFLLLIPSSMLLAQCPATSCASRTTTVSTNVLLSCGGVSNLEIVGDIKNNSDCEDGSGDNCHKFVFIQDDPIITGINTNIGKGNCSGPANTVYTDIDGFCVNNGSSSGNNFSFEFGGKGEITIWICDNSSAQVLLCDVCAEELIPQPVELSAFTGAPKFGMVELSWVTASETDNEGFEIQRSRDGSTFETIGHVAGNGTTTAMNYYTFMDKEALPLAYYRLKQMDYNGAFEYSSIISIKRVGSPSKLTVYPTHSKEEVTIRMETSESRVSVLRVANTNGQVLREIRYDATSGTEYLNLNVQDYPAGVYYVALTQEKNTVTQKFVVVRD